MSHLDVKILEVHCNAWNSMLFLMLKWPQWLNICGEGGTLSTQSILYTSVYSNQVLCLFLAWRLILPGQSFVKVLSLWEIRFQINYTYPCWLLIARAYNPSTIPPEVYLLWKIIVESSWKMLVEIYLARCWGNCPCLEIASSDGFSIWRLNHFLITAKVSLIQGLGSIWYLTIWFKTAP